MYHVGIMALTIYLTVNFSLVVIRVHELSFHARYAAARSSSWSIHFVSNVCMRSVFLQIFLK